MVENINCIRRECLEIIKQRREWLEIIKQGVATQIFNELEEFFGLHETDCNGADVLVKLTVSEDIVMNYDNKSMNQLNIYRAIKEKHGVKE